MADAPPVVPAGSAATLPALALDGLSGAGKSSVGRAVALDWGWAYLDTGATYRAVTLAALAAGAVAPGADRVVEDALGGLTQVVAQALWSLDLSLDPRERAVLLGSRDVTTSIRGQDATATVSAVSAVPAVRRLLVAWQRATVLAAVGSVGGCVCEGRDIGGVVLPDAAVKVWLTADAHARAGRRAAEAGGASAAEVRRAVDRRDTLDSGRVADPARPAQDAAELDTTDLTVPEVVAEIVGRLLAAGLSPARAWV